MYAPGEMSQTTHHRQYSENIHSKLANKCVPILTRTPTFYSTSLTTGERDDAGNNTQDARVDG